MTQSGFVQPGLAQSCSAQAAPRPEPDQRRGIRVRIFNVKYSPNLGDGLLSECLEQALIDCGADADTWSVDLAARTRFGDGAQGRSARMRVLEACPKALRGLAVRMPLAIETRRRWRPHYRTALTGADCVVIGGGNLLADLDLNFPTKIALAVDEAARAGLPVFIYGCGVSGGWSKRGRALLDHALGHQAIRSVFVRDERSQTLWNELAGTRTGLEASIVRDPGLMAADRYGIDPERHQRHAGLIGINVTSQLALRYHSAGAPSSDELDAWYVDLARTLAGLGHDLAVFTNGSPEDRACVERLRPAFTAAAGDRSVAFPQLQTPEDLTRLIAGMSALVAFRMHAIIAAYSCAVPFLALAWDPKLDAFVHSVERGDWLCRPVKTSAADAARQLLRAAGRGISPSERAIVVGQARSGVAALHAEMLAALA